MPPPRSALAATTVLLNARYQASFGSRSAATAAIVAASSSTVPLLTPVLQSGWARDTGIALVVRAVELAHAAPLPALRLAPKAAHRGEQGVVRVRAVHALEVAVHGLPVLAEVGSEGRFQLGRAAVAAFDFLGRRGGEGGNKRCRFLVVKHVLVF